MLRGIAALAVVGRHLSGFLSQIMPNSYLAVDLFFGLSGFVIAHAYQERLSTSMSLREFMKIRLIRLYPMYLLGILLSVVFILVLYTAQHKPVDPTTFIMTLAFGLLFFPTPQRLAFNGFHVFPFNFPAWSLCWELVVNALYAVLTRVLSNTVFAVVIGFGAILLIMAVLIYGNLDGGSNFNTFYSAPLRIFYSFFVGVAVFRVWQSGALPWLRLHPAIAATLLIASFAIPTQQQAFYDLAVVMIGYPLLILAATREPGAGLIPVFTKLGLISFPIYALHGAFQRFEIFAAKLLQARFPWSIPLLEIAFLIGMSVVAIFAEKWLDRPIRKWLATVTRRPLHR
jgi:peptidoglycan/LPS O-acetylase OafA/YrhL